MTMVRPARARGRPTARKQRAYQAYSFPAPTQGWLAANNLTMSAPGAAHVLENIFPTAQSGIMRRGKSRYATLGLGENPVRSVFSYVSGNNKQLFATDDTWIYNITTVVSPLSFLIGTEDGDVLGTEDDDMIGVSSALGLEALPNTNGRWIVARFQASTGQDYLIGVNGSDPSFVYDGTAFFPQVAGGVRALDYDGGTSPFTVGEILTGGTSGATGTIYRIEGDETAGTLYLTGIAGGTFQDNEAITDGEGGSALANGAASMVLGTDLSFEDGGSLTSANLAYVWTFKNRVYFLEKETMNAWYLPVGQIAGELVKFPLGGELSLGGHLVFGAMWSQDVGDGLNALWVVVSSEGEAAVYQGSDPGGGLEAWSQVGVYRVGRPLGDRCHVQIGGDLVIATDTAFVPLSQALSRDYSQLAANALSWPIEAEWPKQAQLRPGARWEATLWTGAQMVAVALPRFSGQRDGFLVMNSRTGKWAYFTNWSATCVHVFDGRMFFGSEDGAVYEANVGGNDDGATYTATYVPVFDQMEVPGYKTMVQARAVLRSAHQIIEKLSDQTDYRVMLPAAPEASVPVAGSYWGAMIWGQDRWNTAADVNVTQHWQLQSGAGEVHAPALQITSGSLIPLDVEIIRTDALFYPGGLVA